MNFQSDSEKGLFITDPTNIRYLTGFIGAAPEEREAYVLLSGGKTYLFTNALYMEHAKKLKKKVAVIEITRERPISQELAKKTKELGVTTLGYEDTNLTAAELTRLQQVLNGVELIPKRDVIETLRQIKSAVEIDYLTIAAHLTDQCFNHVLKLLKPGVTESAIAWEMQSFFRKNGASDAFSPIVAFGKNTSQPHYQPMDDQPLITNQIVLLDFGARVHGYCADMTRVVFIGRPKDEWKKTYEAVLTAEEKAIELLARGERSGSLLDQAARDVITNTNLPVYPHSLGHNVGLAIHEGPRLSVKKNETLKAGMVFSIEPGVYIQGQYGIRIEDLVRLTDSGIDILTQSSKKIIIL